MKRLKNILALLIAPLAAPVSFTVWSELAIGPRSFSGLLSALPGFYRYATPVAYMAATLFGIPALLILSRKKCLTLPFFILAGILIGTMTGLFTGFYIAGYDIGGMADYFNYDLISIYIPSALSGMICSVLHWAIRTFSLKKNGLR